MQSNSLKRMTKTPDHKLIIIDVLGILTYLNEDIVVEG